MGKKQKEDFFDSKITVGNGINLGILNSDQQNQSLSSRVCFCFGTKEFGQDDEYFSVYYSQIALMDRATKDGLLFEGDGYIHLTEAQSYKITDSDQNSDYAFKGVLWVLDAEKDKPRTLAVANVPAYGKPDEVFDAYMESYIEEICNRNQINVDQISFAMDAAAKQLFDDQTLSGKLRTMGNRSVTIYHGEEDITRKIASLTHPNRDPNKIQLL